MLIVVAAIAAFASTGNAGILSASRYPLAMARDHLLSPKLASIGRFGTPVPAIVMTAAVMIFCIVVLDVEAVAKLASAFQLLIFAFVNLAVIVMRESRIASYVPGFRSPLYPWMQVFGIAASLFLIAEMGLLSISLTLGLVLGALGWYFYYVRPNHSVDREGAIYHLFERLGRRRYDGLDSELRAILKEKGIADEAPFEELVASAAVVDLKESESFEQIVDRVSHLFAESLPYTSEQIAEGFLEGRRYGARPVSHGVALPHQHLAELSDSYLAMVRCQPGLCVRFDDADVSHHDPDEPIHALFFLVSPDTDPGRHLGVLASIASRIDEDQFMPEWRAAVNEQELKEVLLHHDRYLSLTLDPETRTADFIGSEVRKLEMPSGVLIAIIHRDGNLIVPDGTTVLEANDRITVIGNPESIATLWELYWE